MSLPSPSPSPSPNPNQVAVCFGGRTLAGILLHLAATGTFSGMPDNTIIRLQPPASRVAASVTAWGCSLRRMELQPPSRRVTTCSGMPDTTTTTLIRAARPSAAGGAAADPIAVEAWPLREEIPPPVQVPLP